MKTFYGTHQGGTHVNEGWKLSCSAAWARSFRLSVSVPLHSFFSAGCNKTATPPTLFLIRIHPSLDSSLRRASERLSTTSEISHMNHSRHTVTLPTQTFSRKTDRRMWRWSVLPFWQLQWLWICTRIFTFNWAWRMRSSVMEPRLPVHS